MSCQARRSSHFLLVPMALVAAASLSAVAAAPPSPVAPGGPEEFAVIAERCPTFIWGGLEGVSAYELVVFEVGPGGLGAEGAGPPTLRAELPGSALAWKPSLGSALEPGGEYAWLIRAIQTNGEPGRWSQPRLFRIDPAPSVAEVRAALDLLGRFLGEEMPEVEEEARASHWLAAGVAAEPAGRSQRPAASGREASALEEPPGLPAVPASVPTVGQTCLSLDGDVSLDTQSGIFKRNVFTGADDPFIWDYEPLYHTAVGRRALGSTTSGIYNTAVGMDALADNTRGSYNTAVGAWALLRSSQVFNPGQGSRNTAVGAWALKENTIGTRNTAVGSEALSSNLTSDNTAVGHRALAKTTQGHDNTAVGAAALAKNEGDVPPSGSGNTAVGSGAMSLNIDGSRNVAVGKIALWRNTDDANTAIGYNAMIDKTDGSRNIAVGYKAGESLLSGSHNIYVGNPGASEDHTIRIGSPYDADIPEGHNRAFVQGIFEALVLPVDGARSVYVSPDGQLGTLASSRRFKKEIRPMGEASGGLFRLRPVTFRFRGNAVDEEQPLSYGLIAEEVAEVYPELAFYDDDGEPYGVLYEALVPMLLNELQKQRSRIETLEGRCGREPR